LIYFFGFLIKFSNVFYSNGLLLADVNNTCHWEVFLRDGAPKIGFTMSKVRKLLVLDSPLEDP
tara:strand:+ start:2090 stop:2278 length:189 start_codon:yes stop_codon:yes gene_type:complete